MPVCEDIVGHRQECALRSDLSSSFVEGVDYDVHKEEIYHNSLSRTFLIDTEAYSDTCSVSSSTAPSFPMEEACFSPVQQNFSADAKILADPRGVSSAPSAFLALPLEIRRTVYHHALFPSPEYRQVLRPLRARYPNSWWGTQEMCRLLRVNRQLHYETEEVLYRSFEFSFQETTPYRIEGFLESIGSRARSLIQRVSCCITMNGRVRDSVRRSYIENWKACLQVLCKEMPSLRKIALQVRFLDGRSLRTTFIESIVDLSREFDNGEREISLLPYDGSSSVTNMVLRLLKSAGE